MGGRGSSSGKAGKGSGTSKAGKVRNEKVVLGEGETPFATFIPSTEVPEGDIFNIAVVKNKDGQYIFKGYIPPASTIKIDQTSQEYQKTLRDYNVHAKFNSDGTVDVTKGGLFTKKRKFKSIDAFEKEATAKLDGSAAFWQKHIDITEKGIISQLDAEHIKSTINRQKMYATATTRKQFGTEISKSMKYPKMRVTAAQQMKARISVVVDEARKKLKK